MDATPTIKEGRIKIDMPAHPSKIPTGRSGGFSDAAHFDHKDRTAGPGVRFSSGAPIQAFDQPHHGQTLAGGMNLRGSTESGATGNALYTLGRQAANINAHATPGKYGGAGLSRQDVHQGSAQSISLISTDTKQRVGGHYASNQPDKAPNSKMEDSTAAHHVQGQKCPGLTEFLRKEYYRRMGVYINGARGE